MEKEKTPEYQGAYVGEKGYVYGPICCGERMKCIGGCAEGCCDDYQCQTCKKVIRVEWPD